MPGWNDLLEEVKGAGSVYDLLRRKYLAQLSRHTGRNTILYYSGWLQKSDLRRQGLTGFELNDNDKNGFMSVIHRLDRSRGLDLILHTPGGDAAATESLVDYLRSMFGTDMRAIVPQLAMSAGTMVACACRDIVMGKQSSLGPIDPQIGGVPAHGVIEEFRRAAIEIQTNPVIANLWAPILAKYSPSFIGECQKAITWSSQMVTDWLVTGMFDGDPDAAAKAQRIVEELGDHSLTLSHARHISADKAAAVGLKITRLEDDQKLQDLVLTVHHITVQTFNGTPAFKIIENQKGVALVQTVAIAIAAAQ